jgi:hypothetical protein
VKRDPVIEKMLNDNPLIGFSIYTDSQSKTVQTFGREILDCLQTGISPDPNGGSGSRCDAQTVMRAHGLFWLWVLGAYEVVRTMCQAKQCFTPAAATQIKTLERSLWQLRIPFAKQELPGKNAPVHAELSIHGVRHSPPDLRYSVEGQVVSARDLIEQFGAVFAGIARSDVVADHRITYLPDPAA